MISHADLHARPCRSERSRQPGAVAVIGGGDYSDGDDYMYTYTNAAHANGMEPVVAEVVKTHGERAACSIILSRISLKIHVLREFSMIEIPPLKSLPMEGSYEQDGNDEEPNTLTQKIPILCLKLLIFHYTYFH